MRTCIVHNPRNLLESSQIIRYKQSKVHRLLQTGHLYKPRNRFKSSQMTVGYPELTNSHLSYILHKSRRLTYFLELSRVHPTPSQVCVHLFHTTQGICWNAHKYLRYPVLTGLQLRSHLHNARNQVKSSQFVSLGHPEVSSL